MERQALAYRIRAFRKLKGLTQSELAEKLGVSIAIVGTIERGTRNVDLRMLGRISEALGVAQEELIPIQARAKGE
ncbi:MAG: Xre family transcriptional regulator [Paenibacillaceae bacterium]|jgi:transcriptional regulator with XRE-family HTH domain|nr:Xre family transcriptional regulator [Paenibacillaceae bacterium]